MINTFKDKKILVLGDIHGRENWKQIVKENTWDLCIFLGDYFDPYVTNLTYTQYQNFQEILDFRNENPDKVVLLIGNHDYHYMGYSSRDRYSRWSEKTEIKEGARLRELFEKGVLQVAYQIGHTLFVHAGVTEWWYWVKCRDGIKNNLITWKDNVQENKWPKLSEEELNSLAQELNRCHPYKFKWDNPSWDIYGEHPCSGPLWMRNVHAHGIPGIEQVVGHTQDYHIVTQGGVTYIDCLGTSGEYLIIGDGEGYIGSPTTEPVQMHHKYE